MNGLIKKADREYYIDVLKGLAMLGVILVHFSVFWNSPNKLLNMVAAIGARCPQLFFLISAYLTWKSLDKNVEDENTVTVFWKKRFSRLAPLFYAAILIAVLIPTFRVTEISVGNYISHFLFVNGIVPEWIDSILGVEWYIADLALFYLLAPLLYKVIKNLKTSVIATLISTVIASLSLIICNQVFATQIATDSVYEMFFHTFFIVHQLPIMLLGVVIFYVIKLIKNGGISWAKSLFIIGVIGICVGGAFLVLNLNKKYACSSLIAGLAFAWLFLFCSRFTFWGNSIFKPIANIGKHSYGIYCFHQIVINCLIFIAYDKNSLIEWIVGLVCITAISYLVGVVAEMLEIRVRKAFIFSKT